MENEKKQTSLAHIATGLNEMIFQASSAQPATLGMVEHALNPLDPKPDSPHNITD